MSDWSPDLERLRAYDDAEWLRVERTFAGRLLAYTTRRIKDRAAREDVVQETFFGAVRGIEQFDPAFTFEQFLFGICRNRVIDHLRRVRMATVSTSHDEDDERSPLDDLARTEETPSRIVRDRDLGDAGSRMLAELLKTWVQETWAQNEFVRLMVVEAVVAAGWRNRDTWERFGLRDETSVAGIKFRAIKRIRELALERDVKKTVLPLLSAAVDAGTPLDIDVALVWKEGRVSCPARHWLARFASGALEEGPASFVRFHVEEARCPFCEANLDDLRELSARGELVPLLERVGRSTRAYLRSRTLERPDRDDAARHDAN